MGHKHLGERRFPMDRDALRLPGKAKKTIWPYGAFQQAGGCLATSVI
jgi:hypothetical protein